MMTNYNEKLRSFIESSPFSKSPNYKVNANLKRLFTNGGSLLNYNSRVDKLSEEKLLTPQEVIKELTPEFQRSNKKWSKSMQIKFVENLICGCESTIQLFEVKGENGPYDDCYILDGLQRSTALAAFQTDEFPIGDGIYWSDLKDNGILPMFKLCIHIYQFETIVQACQFYIDFNKGITHSEEDLISAYQFIEKQKSNDK